MPRSPADGDAIMHMFPGQGAMREGQARANILRFEERMVLTQIRNRFSCRQVGQYTLGTSSRKRFSAVFPQ